MNTDLDPPVARSRDDQVRLPEHGHPTAVSGSAVPFVLAAAVLVAMLYGGFKWWQVRQFEMEKGQAVAASLPGPPLTEFELTNASGRPFRTADMRGKVWVATYFFTTCPGSCVRLNRNIKMMHNLPQLADVTWVSITCDPETDTLEALSEYAKNWEADRERWLFCRANLDYTRRVARGMNLFLSRQGHQDYAVVIDKAGKIRGMLNAASTRECQRLIQLLTELVEEEPPQDVAAATDVRKKLS